MKLFVLDCSVTMAWCFEDESNAMSDKILASLKESKAMVPSIWPLEVINVLRVGERKKRLSASQSNTFINLLRGLPIEVDMNPIDLPNQSILEISREYSISAYDAAYLELALRKNLPLVSFDKILCEAAKNAGIEIK